MRRKVLWALLVPALLATTAGCQRINFNKTYSLSKGEVKDIGFSAPAYSQKVTVTIAPTSGPVSAYLGKTDDDEALKRVLDAINKEPPASLILGSKISKDAPETYSFEATVPAKTAYTLWLRNGNKKATEVKVTLVGR